MIFDALIESFSCLAASDGNELAYERAFHIVTSLATVRSCCILAELAAEKEDDDTQINRAFGRMLDVLGYVCCCRGAGVLH